MTGVLDLSCSCTRFDNLILEFESESIALFKNQNDTHKCFKTWYNFFFIWGGQKLENDDVIFKGGSGNDDG